MAFLYVMPSEMWALDAPVTTASGSTDADYVDDWLTDRRASRPARATSGSVTWSITAASGEVGLIAMVNHNVTTTVTIGGGVSTTLTIPTLPPNGIPLNPFATVTPAAITSLTVAVSGSATAVTIGELIAGKYRTLSLAPFLGDTELEARDFRNEPGGSFGGVLPYDRGIIARTLTGTQVYPASERAVLQQWFEGQRSGSKPSLIVPNSSVNDAWLCQMTAFSYRQVGPDAWRVTLSFEEYPRIRW